MLYKSQLILIFKQNRLLFCDVYFALNTSIYVPPPYPVQRGFGINNPYGRARRSRYSEFHELNSLKSEKKTTLRLGYFQGEKWASLSMDNLGEVPLISSSILNP
jgi:hypothetical protein